MAEDVEDEGTVAARGQQRSGRLAALRAELARRHLSGFVVPRSDEHQGEYLPKRSQRLAWLTGFTGSAGLAVVLSDRAAAFTDGRYTLQIRQQVDTELYETRHITDEPPADWIAEHLGAGGRLGYDPWLHTMDGVARLSAAAQRAGGALVAVDANPIDAVWPDRPPPPLAPIVPHPVIYAGEESREKRAAIARQLADKGEDAAFIAAPDSIAWLLNVRGGDVPHTPLPLSFAVLDRAGAVDLFVDRRKLTEETRSHLGNGVAIRPPEELAAALDALAARGAKVRVDAGGAPAWVWQRLSAGGAEPVKGEDPCALPRARKNPVELDGARRAHRRDGVAMIRFLKWLGEAAPGGTLGEIAAADRLAAFRADGELFRDLSFDTISGAGPNGAIVHYRVTAETERRLQPGELYLVDSGAQYLDGTTDITRTVAIGEPTGEHRDRYTRVLKGHLAISMARFPKGTTGSQIDALARRPLWQVGLDFDHGTGHGIGSYLNVHEGPHRISKVSNSVALEPGMIVSNEPGYYKAGGYGIRIENLVVVTPVEIDGAERPFLGFETLTLCPYDRRLIDVALLTAEERAWIDAYHRRVREALSPHLGAEERGWLEAGTAPL